MTLEKLGVLLRVAEVMIGGVCFCFFLYLGRNQRIHQRLLGAYQDLAQRIRQKQENSSWYRKRNLFLQKHGATFHFGTWVEPIRFLALELCMGLAGFVIASTIDRFLGMVAFFGMFALPTLLLLHLNRRDNEKMLPELRLVYHALEIQIKAGVYVTDALAECYGSVRDRRLRSALLELAGNLVMKADVAESLEKLLEKFENKYIDALCVTILQALESGQAVELLKDLSEQLKDMEETVLNRRKASLDRYITFAQLGVLTIVLAVALYCCVRYLFQAASGF